jgi:hypothetical protein
LLVVQGAAFVVEEVLMVGSPRQAKSPLLVQTAAVVAVEVQRV